MKKIKVGTKWALVDDKDYEILSDYKWYLNNGYARTDIYKDGIKHREYMHRMLLPDAKEVDHKNRDKLDNRRRNIRFANSTINKVNRAGYNKLGIKGVYKNMNGDNFHIKVKKQGFGITIGGFDNSQEAGHVYREIVDQLWPGHYYG